MDLVLAMQWTTNTRAIKWFPTLYSGFTNNYRNFLLNLS